MLELLFVAAAFGALYAFSRSRSAANLAPETGIATAPSIPASSFSALPIGGVAISPDVRAVVTATMTPAESVTIFQGQAGRMVIAPGVDTGNGMAIDTMRQSAPQFDLWMSNQALAGQPGLVVFAEPGKVPIMDSAQGEPPVAGSAAAAANMGAPAMFRWSAKGESF